MGARNRHRLEHCSICALRGSVTQSAPEPPCRCHCEASISRCPFLDPALSIGGDGCRLFFFPSSTLVSISLWTPPSLTLHLQCDMRATTTSQRETKNEKEKKNETRETTKQTAPPSNWLGSQWLFVPQAQWREKRCAVPVAVHPRGGGVSLSLCLFLAKAVPVSVWTDALRMLRSYGQVSPQSRIRRVAAPCSPAGLTQTGPVSHHGTNAQCQMANGDHPCARWCCHTDGRWHCINLPCYLLLLVLVNAGSKKQRLSFFDAMLQVVLLPLVLVRGPSRTCRRVTCMSTLGRPTAVVPTSTRLDSTQLDLGAS